MDDTKEIPFLWTLLQIGSIWIISDIGYYIFLPIIGVGGGYTTNPLQITAYYLFWLAITISTFWSIYSNWKPLENRWLTYILLCVGGISVFTYLTYVLPLFPSLPWAQPKPPSELLFATPWYFLPKSIDILLQQLLVAAMVLVFSFQKYSLKTISIWCALLFGGAHLLLVFGGASVLYVTVFTATAIIASFIFPYLLLRVKNGFIYSYLLHWLFYAVIILLARILINF